MINTKITSPNEIWSKYFCKEVNGQDTKKYLTDTILPRPRDLIFLSRDAIAQAVNRGHTIITENDILEAEKNYSRFAIESLLVENGISVQKLEDLLYEFVASPEIITTNEIMQALNNCDIPEEKLDEIITHLCDLTFLGIEIEQDRFAYIYNEEDKKKLHVMARKLIESKVDTKQRFKINKPFHAYLEIKPVNNT